MKNLNGMVVAMESKWRDHAYLAERVKHEVDKVNPGDKAKNDFGNLKNMSEFNHGKEAYLNGACMTDAGTILRRF